MTEVHALNCGKWIAKPHDCDAMNATYSPDIGTHFRDWTPPVTKGLPRQSKLHKQFTAGPV